MAKQRKYTIEQIDEIVDKNNWSLTVCNDEQDGAEKEGTDTIQISAEEDSEYFGAFIGNEEDGYIFKFYV
jgi:hypothetical protein